MYELTAVIADEDLLRGKAAGWENAAVVALREGLGLLPMPNTLFTEILGVPPRFPRGRLSVDNPFHRDVPPALEVLFAEWSRERPIAYVEADFFGGDGYQSVLVWSDERRWGPVVDEEFHGPRKDWPINAALARLGLRPREGALDLFDIVGLGRERKTEDWLALGREG